jgi:glutamate-1-semialdehyde 2,1-aminomutase
MSQVSKSGQLFQRAIRVMPGGVSRNAVLKKPHPIYASHGKACRFTDVEGITRIDFANNMASLIHGHSHPLIVEAVTRQLHRGTAYSFATEEEILLAEHICTRSSAFEKIRFVNSGTEAVMCCLKAARAFTGRPKIAKVEGAYHGIYDYAETSQTAAPVNWGEAKRPRSVPVVHGTPQSALDEVIVLPFNDPEKAIALLDEHVQDIACVLIDPLPHRVGVIPASHEFVTALRKWTSAHGALLVFDEVITFRSEYGGAQQWYQAKPDLTALGKIIGGGFPVGAITGRAYVMDVFNPLLEKVLFPHSGTFSANPITMTAGLAAMKLYDQHAVSRLNKLSDEARCQITSTICDAGVPTCVTGAGSMFRIHFKAEPPKNYREAYASAEEAKCLQVLLDHLYLNDVMLISTGTGTLSTPMTNNEIDELCSALKTGFKRLKEKSELRAAETGGMAK